MSYTGIDLGDIAGNIKKVPAFGGRKKNNEQINK